jgi:hypothetical protein
MGGNKVTGLGAPSANGDALRYDMLGANSGIATLDAGGKVPASQLPNAVMTYEGTFDASATEASPLLNGDGAANAGMVYLATVAGNYDFGAGGIDFAIGDWAVYNGSIWQKSTNSNSVVSVNGQTGVVTVNAINQLTGDITAGPASGSESKAATIAAGAVTGSKIASDTITNSNINSAAAIAESKLSLDYSTSSLNTAIGNKVTANSAITGATKTKITYDAKGLVTAGADATTADIADSTNKRYVTDADLVDIGNLSGVNTGDQTITLTGDVTGSGTGSFATTVVRSPSIQAASETAGEAFSASTIYAVRYAQSTETPLGRIYKADLDATTTDNFWVIGITKTSGALSAADPMPAITKYGLVTMTSHGFTIGKPVFLSASGALTSTAPTTANHAIVKVGMVKDANTIDVNIQVMGIN